MANAYENLKAHLGDINDLHQVAGLLGWDQQTLMPPRGAAARAEQMATLARLTHERFISVETGRLLDAAATEVQGKPYESDEASLIRLARRDYDKARRVPSDLEAEMARLGGQAYPVWKDAKHASDFAAFLPYLDAQLELKQRYISCFDVGETPYDILLDDFEPGMTTAHVAETFTRLKTDLIPLVAWVMERADSIDDSVLYRRYPIEEQRQFVLGIIERFGYAPEAWRLDATEHPFASSIAIDDIRITTRFEEGFLGQGLFATMHECGHGLYEHGVDQALARTPLARGASMAMHESQSRTWENLVGRSRPFWRYFFPLLAKVFPEELAGVDEEAFWRAASKMQPSLIRVEADEATYNLHIILRFEIEQELISGSLAPRDVPGVWKTRMHDYLGIDVPDDARGVLQDVHWADGLFGYFPTYALGNIVAAQLFERVRRDLPDVDEQFARGEFARLRQWQGEHLHQHGRKFTAPELLERIVGGPMDPDPLVRYLTAKITDLYGAPPATAAD